MPRHPSAIALIALVCLLCSNKNAAATADAKEEKPRAIGAIQDSHQSSATHEPVLRVGNYNRPILSQSDTKRVHPRPEEAKLTVLDASNGGPWCIAKPSTDADQLQRNINYVCRDSSHAVNCDATSSGGYCYTPGNKVSEASFDMNLHYQSLSPSTRDCDFNNSGLVISQDPSWGACKYPAN